MNFADLGAIKHIIQKCRARDRAEIEALYGLQLTLDSAPQWASSACLVKIFDYNNEPVAFVAAHAHTHTVCTLSMIATEDWRHVAASVIKWAKRSAMPALYLQGFKRAECRSISGHPEAFRFLTHLGFVCECTVPGYGRNGEEFLQFAFVGRTPVHVFQRSQNPSTSQTAAA
jgi:hypothetical protein